MRAASALRSATRRLPYGRCARPAAHPMRCAPWWRLAMPDRLLIRPATTEDAAAIWSIIAPIIRAGETYALDRALSEADALAYWMGSDRQTFVAEEDGHILGTYYLRANQAGG